MTTAARPTWKPASGGLSIRETATFPITQVMVRALPSHTTLKLRQPGQNTSEEIQRKDLRIALTQAEEEYFERKRGGSTWMRGAEGGDKDGEVGDVDGGGTATTLESVLQKASQLDADDDSEDGGSNSSQSDSSDDDDSSDDSEDDDDTAELLRELEKIKQERAAERERQEREQMELEASKRDEEILTGNPLLAASATGPSGKASFTVKRRWDDDVVFKNQTRGLEENPRKRFVNDLLRSDFHKKFMQKYIR